MCVSASVDNESLCERLGNDDHGDGDAYDDDDGGLRAFLILSSYLLLTEQQKK